jgi:fused signal recognition particle receptor
MNEANSPSGSPDFLQPSQERRLPDQDASQGFWKKLKRGLFMTHTEILDKVNAAVEGRGTLDEETLEYLEEALISSDIGVETTLELMERIRRQIRKGQEKDIHQVRQLLADEMALLLLDAPQPPPRGSQPVVTLLVGVNGVGKTTTIAKLARRALDDGEKVLLAAADTFRAAAIEQLVLWGQRLGVEVIRQNFGADPAAVVFDGIQAARARGCDQLIVDTAGRLHTKGHLMQELAKIRRVVDREAQGWHCRTLLVLDATNGQNALVQAKQFLEVAKVDGVVLTKMDGTAKGGMAVAIARELRLPVLFLGIGEGADDLIEFRPREFASALLG